ncbi:MAG TPA: PP2C family protein-serine/threonine phosphatase [Bacteroidia bacterium]|nr:PP2C family protein-serine/threonine phosphatase [Bacteroidia bacterium]
MASTPKQITGAPETISAELHVKKLQLHWLLQITKAINYSFSTKQMLDVYEHVLISQLKVEKLALLINVNGWSCALSYGTDKGMKEFDIDKTLNELNHLHNLETERELWIKTFDSMLPVHHKDHILAYALIGGFENSVIPKKNELVSFIQTITNLIVVAIENNNIAQEKIRQAGIRKELELAAQMQALLFPVDLTATPEFDVHATYLPHQEVGGDYYDYIPLNDDEFVFCMADVSGKGIPAALLMSNFQANLHAHVHHITSLSSLVRLLNTKVYTSAKGEKFITFFIGRFNIRTKELHYVNAGHNPPFLIHEKVVYMLNEGSTGLGMFEELPFVNPGKVFIPENAQLHCYTDGVTDVENSEEREFGMERLREFLTSKAHLKDLAMLQQDLVATLKAFKENRDFTDDITLLSFLFKGSG